MYAPSRGPVAPLIMCLAILALADASVAAWWYGSAWGLAASAGAIIGLTISIAWAFRRHLAAVSLGLLGIALTTATAFLLNAPRIGLNAAIVGGAVLVAWFLINDVWLAGRAHTVSAARGPEEQSSKKAA